MVQTSWLDYKSHFESCATLCQWTYREKGLYLSVSLRGLAQGVLGNLAYDTQMDYDALVQALNDRFAPPDQMELYRIQLKERRQRASETLPELAHQRRMMVQRRGWITSLTLSHVLHCVNGRTERKDSTFLCL